MNRPSGPRKTTNLPESLHQQLNMYALAAGAAGVGVLALAQPADAKIVYTPAHKHLPHNKLFYLDGVDDFKFALNSLRSDGQLLSSVRLRGFDDCLDE
jgi:hypothetical protein